MSAVFAMFLPPSGVWSIFDDWKYERRELVNEHHLVPLFKQFTPFFSRNAPHVCFGITMPCITQLALTAYRRCS